MIKMEQYKCPNCGSNVRSIGTPKGTIVVCRHCDTKSETKEDNYD